MVVPTIALLEYLRNTGTDLDGDFLREGIALLTHLLAGPTFPAFWSPDGVRRER